jgi:dipeptidyl-peptidase-4
MVGIITLLLLTVGSALAAQPGAAAQAATYLGVRAPEALAWSPDRRRLAAYLGNSRDGEIRVYDVATKAMTPVATGLPRTRRYKDRTEIRWSADGSRLVYRHGTRYYEVAATGGKAKPLWTDSLTREIVVLSPAGDQVSFVREGDLWVQPLPEGEPRKLAEGHRFLASQAEFYGRFTQWTPWSPDGRYLTYQIQSDSGIKLAVARVSDGGTSVVPGSGLIWDYQSVEWGPDGRLAVSRLARDFQRKQLLLYDVATERARLLWEDTDPEWVNHNIDPSFGPSFSPDGKRLAYVSNRSGWRQLYLMELESGAARPMSEPGVEVGTVWWSPDGASILMASGRGDRHSVRLWLQPVSGGEPQLLTPGAGTLENAAARGPRPDAVWSADGRLVGYGFTRPDDPFQIAVVDVSGGSAQVLHSATALELPLARQARMEAVQLTARDGAAIPGVLLTPRAARPGHRLPALVYHYGGWGQQARLGWGLGIKSRLFQYLVSRGYLVLIADVRGSEGYGRTHSHGLYRQGGGIQSDDLVDAAAWLRRSGRALPNAVASFGHSYGAYLALTTMVRAPAAFQAGVLQAGVYDWSAFGGGGTYVRIRFGGASGAGTAPEIQLSPVKFLSRLTAPVLVSHGTNDFNAPIQFSEQLVRALLRADREFEYSVYPNEPHDWDSEEVDRDFLVRTERFLTDRLRRPAPRVR